MMRVVVGITFIVIVLPGSPGPLAASVRLLTRKIVVGKILNAGAKSPSVLREN
jgi:hypothetical protein